MNQRLFAMKIQPLLMVLAGLLFFGYFASCAWQNKKPKLYFPEDAQTVGIIDPDGIQSVWLVPDYESGDVFQELAKHPVVMVEGVQFYKISTWKDTAGFMAAMGRRHEVWIQALVADNQRLSKINQAYRVNNTPQPAALSERVRALEEKFEEMEKLSNMP